MKIQYASLSIAGPVRPHNEDSISFWQPEGDPGWRERGAVVVLADGVGGQDRGEVASRLACDAAIQSFRESRPGIAPTAVLFQMFNAANLAVYDQNLADRGRNGKMATTLTASIFRHNEVSIGHVGDCRVYAVQQGRIRRVTNDHSYAGVQLKLGLVTVDEAMSSSLRSVLTRSVGQEPTTKVDYHSVTVSAGDIIVQCCDGLWSVLTEGELYNVISKMQPADACAELIKLAERRGADDNLSVQVIKVDSVERLSYYRGLPTYQKENPAIMGTELEVGQTLDGRYLITDLVSRSGMASIFKARDIKTDRVVALKVPFMQFESDPGFFSRFQREQEIGQTLRHPYILRVEPEDPETRRSRPYLVMEYLEGQTLGHLMHTVRPMPVHDALKITSFICEALHYMHEHDVVHRDMKPDNVMICNDGTIRVMDFGIAKSEGRRLTFGGFTPAMGTPDYMAPEQVRGRRGDPRTDIFSLGAILYEMVTGSVPFEGNNPFIIMNARLTGDPAAPRSRNSDLSPQVEEIVLHAMARDPNQRYATALAMKHDLDNPDAVQVTGRADRLVEPVAWRGRWARLKWYILAGVVPVLIILLFYVSYVIKKHIRWTN